MQRTSIIETGHRVGEDVQLMGWVHTRRKLGKIGSLTRIIEPI